METIVQHLYDGGAGGGAPVPVPALPRRPGCGGRRSGMYACIKGGLYFSNLYLVSMGVRLTTIQAMTVPLISNSLSSPGFIIALTSHSY